MKAARTLYRQEPHSCTSDTTDCTIELRVEDAGAGEYLVINANEWSIDSAEGMEALFAAIRSALAGCQP